ncbi:hypothetical protein VTN96DRAFT_6765 [Rasamsonia emersonii]
MRVGGRVGRVIVGQLPGLTLRGAAGLRRQDGRPSFIVRFGDLLVADIRGVRSLQRRLLAVVPDKVGRVDLDALDGAARNAQLDHDPVVWFRVVPPRLPPVVPGACVHEHPRPVDGRGGREQVRGRGEVFIGAGEHDGVEGGRSEVGGTGEDGVDLVGRNPGRRSHGGNNQEVDNRRIDAAQNSIEFN